jgi:hypothetical protein
MSLTSSTIPNDALELKIILCILQRDFNVWGGKSGKSVISLCTAWAFPFMFGVDSFYRIEATARDGKVRCCSDFFSVLSTLLMLSVPNKLKGHHKGPVLL